MPANIQRLQYLCVCEGQQETLYLQHIARLLKTKTRQVVFNIKVGAPGDILKQRAIKYEKVILFDHDNKPDNFENALRICAKLKCHHAYSSLNFDLWLLLHKKFFASHVTNNDAYVKELRDAFGLEANANIKKYDVIQEKILPQIQLKDVKFAIKNAQQIRSQKLSGDAIQIGKIKYYANPDFSIQAFLLHVFKECGEGIGELT